MTSGPRSPGSAALARGARAVVFGLVMAVMTALRAHAGAVAGSLDLAYQSGRQRTDGQEDMKTRIVNEHLDLDYEGTMYRSWVGTYRLGGTFARTDTDRNGEDTTATLEAYRLQGNLFPYSPFPLSLYAVENDSRVAMEGGTDDFVNTRMYGANLLLDFKDLPTTTVFHYGQETTSLLSASATEQSSDTTGIGLKKQWRDLTALLRYEHSDYAEKLSAAEAQADRLTTSWTYRPSGRLQVSVVGSLYDRTGNNPVATIPDPLYSDRQSDSGNVALVWSASEKLNVSASANYYRDEYPGIDRRADDARLAADYRMTENLSLSASGYTVRTIVNDERVDSRDTRAGLTYARHGTWRGAEWRGHLAAGYFSRATEPSDTGAGDLHGGFYQIGGGLQRPFATGEATVTPYYDLSYDRNQQTALAQTTTFSHEPGVRVDGRMGKGRLTGNLSYRQTKQLDGIEVTTDQLRAYLDFFRSLRQRGLIKLQAGYSRTDGRVIGDPFTAFTTENRTDLKSHYLRGDLALPLFATGLMWRNSVRGDLRESQTGSEERIWSYETNLSQQFGMLYYECGYRLRRSDTDGVGSEESLLFFRVRRPFSSRF